MGLIEILQAMEQKTGLQIAEVEGAADRESRSIIDRAEQEAKRIKEKYHAQAEEKLRPEQRRLFGAAKLASQQQLAVARETWLDQVLARAQQQLTTLRDGASYARGFEQLAREAIAEIGPAVKLEIAPRDEELARRIMASLEAQGELVATLATSGGLRASSLDGRISVDNRVEARLDNAWSVLRQRLAVLLTSEEASCPATTVTPTRASEP
jgi:vacuolar-type H+-ATPase subunit E/Vma4